MDIGIYDVDKCFDSLWVEECINDIFDTGIQNDKLNLLYLMNQNAQVAIKTPQEITQRERISNLIMQGTFWGSLFCTATMDKLGMNESQICCINTRVKLVSPVFKWLMILLIFRYVEIMPLNLMLL